MTSPSLRACAAAGALLALCATATAGQQAGLPVDYAPAHLPVRGAHLDFGVGSGFAGTGRLRSIGGRFQSAFGKVQIFAGGHFVSPASDVGLEDGLGLQAAVALRVMEARPRRVANVQAGIGWLRLDGENGGNVTMIDVPLGFALGAYLPTPAGPAEAWVAPRIQLRHVSIDASVAVDDGTRLGPGLSTGLRFTLAEPQAGFSLSLDALALRDPADTGWQILGAFRLALHLLLLR